MKEYNNLELYKDIERELYPISDQINNLKVLIIGGAGTIGSNYIKELIKFRPKKITVVDINENGLTELTRDLRSSNLLDYNPDYITYPVNLLDSTFNKIFESDHYSLVANFSAHKHVRSEKDIISIEALIRNNVYGAIKLLKLCDSRPPDYFFSVSTDKAANPVNVMGASKSLMEKLILSNKYKFRVSTARFANVAFSNGSLLDGYSYRLRKQQPLSCPNDIKRFFVTPEQSGQICLLATFLNESGNIFFPKLDFHNDQIYFKDITLSYLKELGFEPHIVKSEEEAKAFKISDGCEEYPVYFFETNTSGEKSYEEFYTESEVVELNEFCSLGYIKTNDVEISFDQVIADFEQIFGLPECKKSDIISVIKKYVPDFQHIETGKHLDQKM